MLGRVADLKFQGSESEDMALHLKIETLLDDIFEVYDLTREKVDLHVMEETESDEDY